MEHERTVRDCSFVDFQGNKDPPWCSLYQEPMLRFSSGPTVPTHYIAAGWLLTGKLGGGVQTRTWGRRWPSAVMGEFHAWMSSPNSLLPLLPSHTLPRVEGEEGQWLRRITFDRMLIYSPTHREKQAGSVVFHCSYERKIIRTLIFCCGFFHSTFEF